MRWSWIPAFAGMTEQGMPESTLRSVVTVPFRIAALAQHVTEWATMREIEVSAIISDEQTGTAASRVYGS